MLSVVASRFHPGYVASIHDWESRDISAFAVHGESIWHRARPLQAMRGYYRIRIGRSHRLMLRWESNEKLEILDLITLEQMDSWIKNRIQGAGGRAKPNH